MENKKQNIFEIGEELENLLEQINENEQVLETGEMPEDLSNKFDELIKKLTDKVDAIGYHFIKKQSEVDALKRMEATYSLRRKGIERQIEYLKKWLVNPVRLYGYKNEKTGEMQLKGEVVTIKDITKDKVAIDPDLIPDEYKKTRITLEIPLQTSSLTKTLQKFIKEHTVKEETVVDEQAVKSLPDPYAIKGVYVQRDSKVSILGIKKLGESK